jgi:DNA-binding NtrC family response regulator
MNKSSILIIDDNRNVLSALRILLENHFDAVHVLANPNLLPAKLTACAQ